VLAIGCSPETVRATPDHPCFVADRGWTRAGELHAGDRLIGERGEALAVGGVRLEQGRVATFNFEVEDDHTYFVAERADSAAVWVHNQCVPQGFVSREQFEQFGEATAASLKKAGLDDTQAYMQGSAVTGKSAETRAPFDAGRVSDYDIALAGNDITARAEAAGIKIKGVGRTGPLTDDEIARVGLASMREKLSRLAGGRPVNFMVFQDAQTALSKARSIWIPRK